MKTNPVQDRRGQRHVRILAKWFGDNHQDAVVAVAEVLNQFRHGFTQGGVPEYAEAFREVLHDLMAKHWQERT